MIEDLRDQIDKFLMEPMSDALRGVDYDFPEFGDTAAPLSRAADCRVRVAHALGSPAAEFLLDAFGQSLRMQIQLNVYRLVIVYNIPQVGALDSNALQPRLARWEAGAIQAGWKIGWRDAAGLEYSDERTIEIYCYAMLPQDFLESERHQLYWMNDIVQMTRSLFLEAKRIELKLS